MKKLIAALIASLAFTAHALPKDEDIWAPIATDATNGDQYSIQKRSGILTKNDNGVPVVAVQGRIMSKEGSPRALSWYVPLQHCDAGQGILVIATVTGDYLDRAPFAFRSGTIAALIAEVMCNGAEKMLKENTTTPPSTTPQAPAPKQQPKQNNGPGMV
jgi:hypothetical protein